MIDCHNTGIDCINESHGGCFIRSRNLLPLARTQLPPRFLTKSVLLLVCVWGVGGRARVCVCVCPMLPVSLDCPFLIVPLVFSNFYLLTNKRRQNDTCVIITVVIILKKWICYGNIFLHSSSVLFCCVVVHGLDLPNIDTRIYLENNFT